MATITPYETKAGKRYRVRYRKPDKSQTDKRGFKTKKEAELFLASVTVAKATGDYIDPQLGRTTISDIAPGWLAGKQTALKPSAYATLASSWITHVEPTWGKREISGIVKSEVQEWASALALKRSATVVIRAHGVLAGMLDSAVDDRRLSRNPARGIELPRKKKSSRVYLTHEQVHGVAKHAKHKTLFLTLAYTGLRWGEVSALKVKHVNALKRRLSIEENAVLVGSVIHVGTPKTHERRSVPYPKFLDVPLANLCEGKGPDDLLFGDGKHHMRIPHPSHSWVRQATKKARADINKITPEGVTPVVLPDFSVHELRHTAASLAISAGSNVKAVQRMLGHASAAMTLDTYSDLFDDDLDNLVDRIDEAARAAGGGESLRRAMG